MDQQSVPFETSILFDLIIMKTHTVVHFDLASHTLSSCLNFLHHQMWSNPSLRTVCQEMHYSPLKSAAVSGRYNPQMYICKDLWGALGLEVPCFCSSLNFLQVYFSLSDAVPLPQGRVCCPGVDNQSHYIS